MGSDKLYLGDLWLSILRNQYVVDVYTRYTKSVFDSDTLSIISIEL